ncbi:hypothetical protein [Enterococcus sp. DIV1420a]|uniref:hypothetical protein n=1 Tax=Enterococcus TaxID=1350 RepID=UPI003F22B80E
MKPINTSTRAMKPQFRVDLLRKLCLEHPELVMVELAERLEIKVEEVYKMIKEYDLPYC